MLHLYSTYFFVIHRIIKKMKIILHLYLIKILEYKKRYLNIIKLVLYMKQIS